MEIKIDLNQEGWSKKALEAKLLEGTVNHLLNELTPDRLALFVTDLLLVVFKDMRWQLEQEIRKHSGPIIKELCDKPEVKEKIRAAMIDIVDEVVLAVKKESRDSLVTKALKAIEEEAQRRARRDGI